MISYFKKIGRATLLAKFDAMPLTLFFKQRKQNSSFCLPKVSNSKLRRRRYSTRLGRGWFLFEDYFYVTLVLLKGPTGEV